MRKKKKNKKNKKLRSEHFTNNSEPYTLSTSKKIQTVISILSLVPRTGDKTL